MSSGRFVRNTILGASAFVLFACSQAAPSQAQINDRELGLPPAHWESVSQTYSIDNRILVQMEFEGDLVVAGEFHGAGGTLLNHIARWDGNEWQPMGDGFNHAVRCLGTYQGRLIAGGDFTASGNRPMSHVAMWNGHEWEPMGAGFEEIDGFDASPSSFVEWNGGVVAGGLFTEFNYQNHDVSEYHFAAFWDGTSWTPMGRTIISRSTPIGPPSRDLVVYRGSLYAAGAFMDVNEFHRPIARWNGSDWILMGPRIDQSRNNPAGTCFAVWDSLLVVGGSFTRLDSMEAHGVAVFDGQSWRPLGTNMVPAVLDVQVHNRHLFACGYGREGSSIVEYDGTSWKTVAGTPSCVRSLSSYNGLLHAAGAFSSNQVAAWNGTTWVDLPAEPIKDSIITDPILLLMNYKDQVLVSRDCWPCPRWVELEELLRPSNFNRRVHDHHGAQPEWDQYNTYPWAIFRGNLFFGLEQWDGTNISHLQTPGCGLPTALATVNDRLYAAARLYDGSTCSGVITAWDGQRWAFVADGLSTVHHGWDDEEYNGWEMDIVRALDGYKNEIVVGGSFSFNDTGRNLGAWNGTAWDSLNGCPNNMVTCLINYHDDLIAAGFFDHVGQVAAPCIARWDGTQWYPMELGLDGPVYAMTIHNDRLIVGGSFEHAGGLEVGSIAAWDGEGWIPLNTGVDGEVLTMVSNQGTLWVGGEFSKAGSETSFHLAKWVEGPRKAAFSNFTALRDASRTIIQVSATYLPFDHQGFLIYRQPLGEPQVLVTPNPISIDEFSVIDPTPPLGPVTYMIAGIGSTGAITEYASTQIAADPTLRFALLPVRPNPFHAQATITFHNAKSGLMHVTVFDLRGRLVSDLLHETLPPGAHSVTWDGRGPSGRSVAAGTYFCRVTGAEGTLVERIVRSQP